MNAIILAGGRGSRLAPLTDDVPKPMLPVYNRPMLDYVLSWLTHFGINDIVCTVGYKSENIIARMREYEGINYKISKETEPLGTAGAVKNCEGFLHENFVVVSGDCVNDVDLYAMMRAHQESGKDVTMAVVNVEDATKFGVVNLDENGDISRFIEKPPTNEFGTLVNAGIYIINKSVLKDVPLAKCDFARDVFPILIQKGKIGAYLHNGRWTDIGSIEDYYKANFSLKNGEYYPFIKTSTVQDKFHASDYSGDSVIFGTTLNTIVGKGSFINFGVNLDGCIVMPFTHVTDSATNCIIGANYTISVPNGEAILHNITNSAQISAQNMT